MRFYVGLDWGGTEHAVLVEDETGQQVTRFKISHDADGLAQMARKLREVAPPSELPVAIERPSGLLVDTLVEAGFPVVPIHPNVVKACRPRYRAAGGKDDAGDAYLLADILRTDGHRFRTLQPLSDEVRALRALVRSRGDLVDQRVAMANQLRALLESFWPGAANIFANIDSAIALAFVTRYPTPRVAARLGEKRLASFLAQHRYPGRRTPTELLQRLRQASVGLAADVEMDAKGELVRAFASVLSVLVQRIRDLTARIEHDVAGLADGYIVMSLPRAGRLNAAQILAEIGDVRRFESADQLASECGVAPVTHESGKHRGVVFRRACNKRLRRAITIFADNSRHASPWAADVYLRARSRGCRHVHAIRILARAWVRVLWRALQTQTPYEIALHGEARKLAAA